MMVIMKAGLLLFIILFGICYGEIPGGETVQLSATSITYPSLMLLKKLIERIFIFFDYLYVSIHL